MPQPRLYPNPAERQRAYRDRKRREIEQLTAEILPPSTPKKEPRKPSRPKRLAAALAELNELRLEYDSWLYALPEHLQEVGQGEQLTTLIEQLDQAIEILEDCDPPRGFGR